jgi:hypothetical protein
MPGRPEVGPYRPAPPCSGHGPDEAGPSRDGAGLCLDWLQGRAWAPPNKTNSDLSDAFANASAMRSKSFFFCNPMRECKDQGGCQAPPPLREGGGAAMNGMSMHGRKKTEGAATGRVLRLAVAASATPHRQRTNQDFCGWASGRMHRRPPAVLPRRPLHSLRSRNPTNRLPAGGTPLSEGGECLRVPHPCPGYGPHRHNPIVTIH